MVILECSSPKLVIDKKKVRIIVDSNNKLVKNAMVMKHLGYPQKIKAKYCK